LTLLGIVIGLLTIAAFVLVALNGSGGSLGPTSPVVVATTDLKSRVAIDSGSITVMHMPSGAIPPLAFTTVKQAAGLVPLIDIKQGQPITSNMVASSGSGSSFLPIPSGYVALTIPTGEQQGVAGYIQPGDYISVIATVTVGAKVGAKTIFTNLHVIRAGPLAAAPASTGPGAQVAAASSLTVVVTECQAEFITWFLTNASLKYALESYHDYSPKDQTPDPSCPAVTSAKGVTLSDVQAQFPTLF